MTDRKLRLRQGFGQTIITDATALQHVSKTEANLGRQVAGLSI